MLFATIIFLLPLIIKLSVDYHKWISHKPVNHTKEWWIIVAMEVPAGWLFVKYSDILFPLSIPIVAGMMMFWFWFLFDGIYNQLRGYNWWFTGSDDKDDPTTDNFLQSLKLWQHIAIKIGGIILFTTLYLWN